MADSQSRAYNDATSIALNAVKKAIETRWRTAFAEGFTQKMLDMVLEATVPQIAALEKMVAALTASFLSERTGHKYRELDLSARNSQGELWNGVTNAFVTGRKALKDGATQEEAVQQSLSQVLAFVDTGTQEAKVKQAQTSLIEAGETRYKRVVHPNESESGSCALCLIASTRVYYVEDLLPIHERCHCDVDTIQDGDITVVDGREYVGLKTLQIPEKLIAEGTRGPKADPDSMRSRLKGYLQDMEKRQFSAGIQAWEKTVDVTSLNQSGVPILKYRNSSSPPVRLNMAPKATPGKVIPPPPDIKLSSRAGYAKTVKAFRDKWTDIDVSEFEKSADRMLTRLKRQDPDKAKETEVILRDFLMGVDHVYSMAPVAAKARDPVTGLRMKLLLDFPEGTATAYGQTNGYSGVKFPGPENIILNKTWAEDARKFQQSVTDSMVREHFFPGADKRIGWQTGAHEAVHGLDIVSGMTNDESVLYELLADAYVQVVNPHFDMFDPTPEGEHDYELFMQWLKKETSGYAWAKNEANGELVLHAPEAVATSVTDVLTRGDKATVASKAIYNYWLEKLDTEQILPYGKLESLRMELK